MAKIVPPFTSMSSGLESIPRQLKLPVQQQLIRSMPGQEWGATCAWQAHPRAAAGFTKVADAVANKVFKTTLQQPASAVQVRALR